MPNDEGDIEYYDSGDIGEAVDLDRRYAGPNAITEFYSHL